jgi:hypothetical protein
VVVNLVDLFDLRKRLIDISAMDENGPAEAPLVESTPLPWGMPQGASGQNKEIHLRFGGSSNLDRVLTVAMPLSLPELQHTAAQNFGHSGCLRLYHHGIHLLYHPTQMSQLKDGDYVIVRRSEHNGTGVATPRMLSTHQADFTKHPICRPASVAGGDHESILTERTKGERMNTMSRYATDYVKHPITPVLPYRPPNALHLHDDKLGTTTYLREYTWREGSKNKKSVDDQAVRQSSLSLAAQQAPFEGNSSYKIDYPRRPAPVPAQDIALPPHSLKAPPTPFSAETTYGNDFKKLQVRRPRTFKPKGQDRESTPFSGTSEYRREYFEKEITDRGMLLHLATEAFDGQAAEELRLASARAAREGVFVEIELPAQAQLMRPHTAA